MTDLSTQQETLSYSAAPARSLRRVSAFLTHLFSSRRSIQFDFRHANAHFLKDIGVSRPHVAPRAPTLERIW